MQTTAGTFKDTLRQGHWLPVSASAACLRCVGRVNRREHSTSFYRFVVGHGEELRPSCIRNALCKATVVNHPVDVQVFNENSSISVNDFAGFLMKKVLAFEPNALVNSGDDLTTFEPFRSTLRFFGKFALDFCKPLLFLLEKAGILHRVSIRERSKSVKANIDTDGVIPFRKNSWLDFAGESHIPFAGGSPENGSRFGVSVKRPVLNKFNVTDFINEEPPTLDGATRRDLRKCKTVIAKFPSKTWISRILIGLHSSKESFESKVDSNSDILKHLTVNALKLRPRLFESRKVPRLIVIADICFCAFPRIFSFCQEMIVKPSAFLKNILKGFCLLLGRENSVSVIFKHSLYVSLNVLAKSTVFRFTSV